MTSQGLRTSKSAQDQLSFVTSNHRWNVFGRHKCSNQEMNNSENDRAHSSKCNPSWSITVEYTPTKLSLMKTRSAVGSLPPTPLDPKERPRPRMSSLDHLQSRLQRGLSRNRSIRSDTSKNSQTPVDAKGALGLNLLQEPSEPQIDFVFVRAGLR